jgi:hypothetical protein
MSRMKMRTKKRIKSKSRSMRTSEGGSLTPALSLSDGAAVIRSIAAAEGEGAALLCAQVVRNRSRAGLDLVKVDAKGACAGIR